MAVPCDYSIGDFDGQRNKYKQQHIDIREVKKNETRYGKNHTSAHFPNRRAGESKD
jgi:hypothetical protein